MRKNLMITPEGTKDYLFEECITSCDVQEKIKNCFVNRGYSKVDTPCIEFMICFLWRTQVIHKKQCLRQLIIKAD
ncbi:MAG: hypothetical protein ACLRX1_03630 [Ruminococcus sp.]